MDFKNWLLRESFELPFESLRKIYEFYKDAYKQYLEAPRKKIEGQLFPLDLTGSNYEFLQYLKPKVQVNIKKKTPNFSGLYYNNASISPWTHHVIGEIDLSLSDFEQVSIATIEHEILHFIQDLIKLHAGSKTIGGLPRKSSVRRILKNKQIDIDGFFQNQKRGSVQHADRPTEFYTNLNDLIRNLQYHYLLTYATPYINDETSTKKILDLVGKDEAAKKLFLQKLINEKDFKVKNLEKIKSLDQELYQIYMREIYKRFVNNDNLASVAEIKKFIEQMKKNQEEKKEVEKTKREVLQSKKLSSKWTEADFSGRLTINSEDFDSFVGEYGADDEIEDSWSQIAEDMFKHIGLNVNKNDQISFSITAKKLKEIFDNIKKAKLSFFKSYDGISQDTANKMFDGMAEQLAHEIYHQLTTRRNVLEHPSKDEILEIFYKN